MAGRDGTLNFDTNISTEGFQKSANQLGNIVKGLTIFQVLQRGLQGIVSTTSEAIERVDVLNRFPRVLESMGYSADSAALATQRLSAGVQGLPTSLNEIVANAQNLTVLTGNLELATDTALALNNAFYASGASTADAQRGLTQYIQQLSKGKVDMQSWRTLQETMGYALRQTAEAFGYAGESATNDLYAALQSGEVTFDQFNRKIVELNEGVGGFADLARTSTGGIATTFQNFRTAIVRGMANLIESFSKFTNLESNITKLGRAIEKVLTAIGDNIDVILPLVTGLVGAFIAFQTVQGVISIFQKLSGAVAQASTFFKQFDAAVIAMKSGVEGAAESVKGFNTTLNTTIIGAVIAGVVAMIGVIDALSNRIDGYQKQFAESIEQAENQIAANDRLLSSMSSLNEEYRQADALAITAAENNRNLVDRLFELQSIIQDTGSSAGATAAAQQEMNGITNTLNSSVKGLGLEVNSTNGEINQNHDALIRAINAQEEYNRAVAGLDYATQKMNTLNDVGANLYNTQQEIGRQQQNLNELAGDATSVGDVLLQSLGRNVVELWDYGKASIDLTDNLKELESQEESLQGELSNTHEYYEQQIADNLATIQSMNDAGESVEQVADRYGISFSQIQSDMDINKIGLQEWENQHKTTLTEAGENIDQVAEKWGVDVGLIRQALADNNIDLNEWDQQQQELFENWRQATIERIGSVVNGFELIPASADISLEELNAILENNNNRMEAWEQNMLIIQQRLGPEMAEVIRGWGPEYNSILEEYLADPNGEKGVAFYEQMQRAANASVDGAQSANYRYQETGQEGGALYGTGLAESTEPQQAAGVISDQVANELLNGDYTSLANAIASAITTGTPTVVQSFRSMAESLGTVLTVLNSTTQGQISTLMYTITSRIQAGISPVRSSMIAITNTIVTTLQTGSTRARIAIDSLVNSVIAGLNSMVSRARYSIETTMLAIENALRNTAGIQNAASGIANSIAESIRSGYQANYQAGSYLMQGALDGMNAYAPNLFNRAQQIANTIANTIRRAWQERSPSKVAYEIADYFMQGIYNGFVDNERPIYNEVDNFADGLVDRFGSIGGNIGISPIIGDAGIVPASVLTSGNYAVSESKVGTVEGTESVSNVFNIYGDVNDPDVLLKKAWQAERFGLSKTRYKG